MIEKVFGDVLRELRSEKNISQEGLAELTELDRTFISLLERGIRQPTLTTIFKIAKAFEISASDIVKRVESKM